MYFFPFFRSSCRSRFGRRRNGRSADQSFRGREESLRRRHAAHQEGGGVARQGRRHLQRHEGVEADRGSGESWIGD